jgi:hypothetical protein
MPVVSRFMVGIFHVENFCDMQIYNARLCVIILLKYRKWGMARKETLSCDIFITIVIGVHIYVNIIKKSSLV